MLQELVGLAGCNSQSAVMGPLLAATIAGAALSSAESTTNTFNNDLAAWIIQIGIDTPTANARTYRTRLLGDTPNSIYAGSLNWAAQRGTVQNLLIAITETSMVLNMVTALYYKKNPALDSTAMLLPQAAVCPICQAGVARNPYPSVAAIYDMGRWPAHPGCIHHAIGDAKFAGDCASVWHGE